MKRSGNGCPTKASLTDTCFYLTTGTFPGTGIENGSLSHPVAAAIPPGQPELFRSALSLRDQLKPMNNEELERTKSRALKENPIFKYQSWYQLKAEAVFKLISLRSSNKLPERLFNDLRKMLV